MIEMHIHAVNPQLPGVKILPPFLGGPPEAVAAALRQQMAESGTEILLGMGHLGGSIDDPCSTSVPGRLDSSATYPCDS